MKPNHIDPYDHIVIIILIVILYNCIKNILKLQYKNVDITMKNTLMFYNKIIQHYIKYVGNSVAHSDVKLQHFTRTLLPKK